jgi:hypothetical protein
MTPTRSRRALTAFAAEGKGGGFIVIPHAVTLFNRDLIVASATRLRLPALYPFAFYAKAGGLISYGFDPLNQFRQAAQYVDRILRGAKPADLPVQYPTKFQLVVNLTTAKALGLGIPAPVLSLAYDMNLHLIGGRMSPETLFRIHLVLGYVAWLLCFSTYIWPRLKAMDRIEAQRAIATLHSFRFFGLVFILPGVVGNLPEGFATFAAYGDFTTGLLAILALLTVRIRPVFWLFVVAFNLVGSADLIIDYYNATQLGLPALAGELGSTYVIPIIYVPLLMITHVVAFYLLVRHQWTAHRVIAANVAP